MIEIVSIIVFAVNLMFVFLDDLDFSGEKQRQRFFPGNDPQRLVRSIQEESRIHTVLLIFKTGGRFVKRFSR